MTTPTDIIQAAIELADAENMLRLRIAVQGTPDASELTPGEEARLETVIKEKLEGLVEVVRGYEG